MSPSRTILVLGATSGIARATTHALARPGDTFILVARDADELARCGSDLRIRHGVAVHERIFDAEAWTEHEGWVEEWCGLAGGAPDGVLLCQGLLPSPSATHDATEALHALAVNLSSPVSLLTLLSERLARKGDGWIVALSSVAGDRGRASNYVYGAGKAGLTAFLSGLRARMRPLGVHVLTVKPGFVDTSMLDGTQRPPAVLVASPERVARDIRRALRRRRDVLYTPWFWWPMMALIRAIPEPIFKRLKL